MKKYLATILLCLILLSCTACQSAVIDKTVGAFSYQSDAAMYASGTPGVKTDGFQNTEKHPIATADDAIALAKNEVTVAYNRISAAFDKVEQIWRLEFWTEMQVGGDQTVYLTADGQTTLCVSGE